MDRENFAAPTPPVGVIESLSIGFETVAGKLALVLLPLLIDLLLWVGPRVSLAPAIDTVVNAYHDAIWQPMVVSFNPDLASAWPEFSAAITEVLGSTVEQYLPVGHAPLFGLPVLLAGREAATLPFDYRPVLWQIDSPVGMAGLRLAALAIGLVLGSFYVGLIAEQVRRGRIDLGAAVRRWPRNLMWLALFVVVLPIIMLVVYFPFVVLGAGFALISPVLGVMVDWGGRLLLVWIALFLVFTVHGMFLNGRRLVGALWDSVRVVQWNMSATIMLVLLILLISVALTTVWSLAPAGSWLALAAIAGNAFISTGLLTASFVFFRDRYRYWRELRAELMAELERRRARQEAAGSTASQEKRDA